MILTYLIEFATGHLTLLEFMQYLVYSLIAVIVTITIHEWGHALVSFIQGDKSTKYSGRLSLNPFAHMDLYGILMFLILGFGWARPVQVRASQYKRPRLGLALTAAAGPIMNFLLAFLLTPLYFWAALKHTTFFTNLAVLILFVITYNLSLALFNLIPVPPLDGSKILGECLPLKYRLKYYGIERYGFIIAFAIAVFLNRLGVFAFIQNTLLSAFITAWSPLLKLIIS